MLGRQGETRRSFLAAIPGDPEPAVMLQQAQKSRADAAYGWLDALFVALAHNLDRCTVGHDHQFAPPEDIAGWLADGVGGKDYSLGSSHQGPEECANNQIAPLPRDNQLLPRSHVTGNQAPGTDLIRRRRKRHRIKESAQERISQSCRLPAVLREEFSRMRARRESCRP